MDRSELSMNELRCSAAWVLTPLRPATSLMDRSRSSGAREFPLWNSSMRTNRASGPNIARSSASDRGGLRHRRIAVTHQARVLTEDERVADAHVPHEATGVVVDDEDRDAAHAQQQVCGIPGALPPGP